MCLVFNRQARTMKTTILALATALLATTTLTACDQGPVDDASSDFEVEFLDLDLEATPPPPELPLGILPDYAALRVELNEVGAVGPEGAEKITLSIVEVAAMRYGSLGEEIWTTMISGEQRVNLLDDPEVTRIAAHDLASGEYSAVRLRLGRSTVWFDDDHEEVVTLPSQSLYIKGPFDLIDMENTLMTINFDGVEQMTPTDRGYDMDPHIQIELAYDM